ASVADRLEIWTAIAGSLARQLAGVEVIPDQEPRWRSVVGYGLDTQAFILDSFITERRGAQLGPQATRFVYDRAHNVLLDHLATGGLVAAAIWCALVAGILVAGARRLRTGSDEDWPLRLGCLGAVLVHLVASVTGVETIVTFALFWIVAAMLTVDDPSRA